MVLPWDTIFLIAIQGRKISWKIIIIDDSKNSAFDFLLLLPRKHNGLFWEGMGIFSSSRTRSGWKLAITVKLFFSGRWFAVVCVSFSIISLATTVDSTGCCHVTEVVWRCGLWLVWWRPVWVFINLSFLTHYNITTATILHRMNAYILVTLHTGATVWFLRYYNIQLRGKIIVIMCMLLLISTR